MNRGQIVNIYQDGKENWVGVCTGLEMGGLIEYINLDNGKKYLVDYENEVGTLLVEDIFAEF